MNAAKSANDTKVKVRELQRTLYLAAKAKRTRRFHALYDKIEQMSCGRHGDGSRRIEVVLKAVFRKLELSMNTEKSKLVQLYKGQSGFDFLGFHHRRMPMLKKRGRVDHPLRSHPSKKAMKKMRAKVTEETSPRNRLYWSPERVLENLKPIIQGWRNYYASIPHFVYL